MISPQQAVDSIGERFGRHLGARALHAKGSWCRGTFTATPAVAKLTRAAHMQSEPVETIVRVSNGGGDPTVPDYAPDVRGLAVSFVLPDGTRTDISAQTAPRFPVRTPDEFIDLVAATARNFTGARRMAVFLVRHPGVVLALRHNIPALSPPTSYGTCHYYAIHAYRWLDADGGSRYVRYHWIPAEEAPRLSGGEAKKRGRDYLQEELRERLARGPIRFTLELQIAEQGDAVDDPTSVWPDERRRVAAGTLEITEMTDDPETGGDVVVFDPARITDGIELSEDPILNFRPRAYSVSVERRAG